MRRSRRARSDLSGSMDSFLDIVTNCLGMLILIATLTTLDSRKTLEQFVTKLGTPEVKSIKLGRDFKLLNFELREEQVFPIDTQVIGPDMGRFARTRTLQLHSVAKKFNDCKVADDYYKYRFAVKPRRFAPTENGPVLVLEPRKEVKGDSIEAVEKDKGRFRQLVRNENKDKLVVFFWVRQDSFHTLRRLREILQKEGFRLSWHPIKEAEFPLGPGSGKVIID